MEATGLAKSLIDHINQTFSLMERLAEHPSYARPENDDTDHMYVVEKLYASYIDSIYSDLFVLTNIDVRYDMFAQAVTKLIHQKQDIVSDKLSEIIEKLCNGFDSSYM